MSRSGVAALDHTVQETNVWLRAVAEQLHFEDRHHAHIALRDRLLPEVAVHLGAQLPMLVRGLYYEGWHMVGMPVKDRSVEEFADHVLQSLPPRFPMDPLAVARSVFEILWERLDPGEFAKLMDHWPASLRTLRRPSGQRS